jgi:hypothetical protein
MLRVILSFIILSVVNRSVFMPRASFRSVVMHNVITVCVIMPNVMAPFNNHTNRYVVKKLIGQKR